MGTGARLKPTRLAEKLRQIRTALDLSQSEMLRQLGYEGEMIYTKISHYELGKREPPLPILLEYARVANVYLEVLVDDSLDLPMRIPSPDKHEGVRCEAGSRKGRTKGL